MFSAMLPSMSRMDIGGLVHAAGCDSRMWYIVLEIFLLHYPDSVRIWIETSISVALHLITVAGVARRLKMGHGC
jgi:predicted lysophospholipase L1 biosynthesis ABC-type transport system permease subunit